MSTGHAKPEQDAPATLNPVLPDYLADPFCFRYDGTDYVIYHAWNKEMTDRQMCVDQLDWTDNRPSVARFAQSVETRKGQTNET